MSEIVEQNGQENIIIFKGMYEDYFLDYVFYVILECVVFGIIDGLKFVQWWIFYVMWEMYDGCYYKVVNIIGQIMQYYLYGDVVIGDVLVNFG